MTIAERREVELGYLYDDVGHGGPFYLVNRDAMIVIGLTGYARAGKNTLADQMVESLGFEQRGFADALKRSLYALNPAVGGVRVRNLVDSVGWEAAKKNPEVRELLQRLGTEGGRDVLGENVWVDALFSTPHGQRLVITDCRFPNEVRAIKDRGGVVVRVERDGYGPANDHPSETASIGLEDFTVYNNAEPGAMLAQLVIGLFEQGVDVQGTSEHHGDPLKTSPGDWRALEHGRDK